MEDQWKPEIEDARKLAEVVCARFATLRRRGVFRRARREELQREFEVSLNRAWAFMTDSKAKEMPLDFRAEATKWATFESDDIRDLLEFGK